MLSVTLDRKWSYLITWPYRTIAGSIIVHIFFSARLAFPFPNHFHSGLFFFPNSFLVGDATPKSESLSNVAFPFRRECLTGP